MAIGLLTPILDGIWHASSAPRFVVRVPKDDLAVLDAIRRDTLPDAVILQKPELPKVSGGRDAWVPILAGRTIYVSPRTTHWREQEGLYDQAAAFFDGSGAFPDGRYDYIYQSRDLNPEGYDKLLSRLAQNSEWRQNLCLPNACLWGRVR